MKLREKFNRNVNFVRPLYRKVKPADTKKDFVTFDIESTIKLCGDGINVSRKVLSEPNKSDDFNVVSIKKQYQSLPNTCDSLFGKVNKDEQKLSDYKTNNIHVNTDRYLRDNNMLEIINSSVHNEDNQNDDRKCNKMVQHSAKTIIVHPVPDTWLRVYPAPKTPGETICTTITRCFLCQLGLTSFLVLWTLLFVFIIHSIEEPYEEKVSTDFEREQNQLVIDLATELRQITPVSPKWRKAIEARLEDERRLTILAVGRGARLHPGHFWDLPGTFLFTIYVMTALGFGAPVPQTVWGRTSTLIYAALAVPMHIYLMVNTSTCLVINTEICMKHLKKYIKGRRLSIQIHKQESANRNSDTTKPKGKITLRRKIIQCIVNALSCGRCVPLVTVIYYVLGVVSFGLLRSRKALESAMFPLEFTTTGGLEHIEGYVRILYGFYVEGAMSLLAYSLASLRRHSSTAVNNMSHKYRLFATEHCNDRFLSGPNKPFT